MPSSSIEKFCLKLSSSKDGVLSEEELDFIEEYTAKSKRLMREEIEEMSQKGLGVVFLAFSNRLDAISDKKSLPSLLNIVVSCLWSWLGTEPRKIPKGAFECAKYLHDCLFEIGNEKELQKMVCRVCEQWWNYEFDNRDDLVPHAIPMLIIFSLEEDAKKTDVKRVFNLRKMLQVLDFEDDSSVTLKNLLLRCYLSPLYLYTEEGLKVLCELCWLHTDFIPEIHATIKGQIPFAKKPELNQYAEIYFRAWRGAGPVSFSIVTAVEHDMIQDIMDCAVYVKDDRLSKSLFHILNHAFHDNKNVKGVDEMLLRLYNPIIWRSLSVANPVVRRNAARILARVFPLQDPDDMVAQSDSLLQKQFTAIETLLKDDSPMVRVVAIQGASRILSVYWELIPQRAAASLLAVLVGDLMRDQTSPEVRTAVLKGLEFISENPLSQNLLQKVLPHVGKLIHDQSRSVRSALVDLLIRVKSMRSTKFYEIVSVDHLLERLTIDKSIASKLTALLQESFFPEGVRGSEQLKRVLSLIDDHPRAAISFFQHLHKNVSVGSVCKLMLLLGKWILSELKKNNNTNHILLASMEGIATLWASVASHLARPNYRSARNQILEMFCFNNFIKPVYNSCDADSKLDIPSLLRIAGQLPCEPEFMREILEDVASYNPSKRADDEDGDQLTLLEQLERDISPSLMCLCSWGKEVEILNCINSTLSAAGDEEDAAKSRKKRSRKTKKQKAKAPVFKMDRAVALWCLQFLFANNHNNARERILEKRMSTLKEILSSLEASCEDDVLALETLMKVTLHTAVHDFEDEEHTLVDEQDEEAELKSHPLPDALVTVLRKYSSLEDKAVSDEDGDEDTKKSSTKKKRRQEDPLEMVASVVLTMLHESNALGMLPNAEQSEEVALPVQKLLQRLPDSVRKQENLARFEIQVYN